MNDKRLAITLNNGRSHVLDLPEGLAAEDAADVIRGARAGSEVGWPDGDGDWLPFMHGQAWAHRSAIVEIQVVEYTDEGPPMGDPIYG